MTKRLHSVLTCIGLALLTVAVFYPAATNNFINFDDQDYVYENPFIIQGLSLEAVKWAFGSTYGGNYHPLTWLSHMADVSLYDLDARGHHLTNLLLHTANGLLLFLLLQAMAVSSRKTNSASALSSVLPAAFVAALFAIHPLHVESVAWVSERKDVLSGLFFMLTLWCYVLYAREQPNSQRITTPRHRALYVGALLCFGLGLLSKPMLVTVPFVLLLLDYWPLNRFPNRSVRLIIAEKIPFLILSVASSVITLIAQARAKAVASMAAIPLENRIENACTAYVQYLRKVFWPMDLAPFYPYDYHISPLLVSASVGIILFITVVALKMRKRWPWLIVGWLWYVGMLFPVIGIVQVGHQALADRYTYLPAIGVFIAVCWGLLEFSKKRCIRPWPMVATGTAVLVACGSLTFAQTKRWKDSETLFRHTLQVTENNAVAHQCLGNALVKQGRMAEAKSHFSEAVRIDPRFAEAHSDLGLALVMEGKIEEGIRHYQIALELRSDHEVTHFNLGHAYMLQNRPDLAVQEFQSALTLNPGSLDTQLQLAAALAQTGNMEKATDLFQIVLKSSPMSVEAHSKYAVALGQQGQLDLSVRHFREAIALRPQDAGIRRQLGLMLTQNGRSLDAVEELREAVRLEPDAFTRTQLAISLANLGRRLEAIEHYEKALQLAPDSPLVLNNLAWLLATSPEDHLRNGPRAVELAERACHLTDEREPVLLGTLAAAYAEVGRFENALESADKACLRASEAGLKQVVEANEKLKEVYRQKRPVREGTLGNANQQTHP